jgi:hypothetical protein
VAGSSTGISLGSVGVLVGAATQAASGANDTPTPTAGATLHTLTYQDAQNWFRRFLVTSAAQAVPDANNQVRYRDNRARNLAGVKATWSIGGSPDRSSDYHWNGSAWTQCSLQQEGTSTPRDAAGRNAYNYCDGYEVGTSVRAAFDIAGRTMLDVYTQAREAGYENLSITGAATALGAAVFPAGSKVYYQSGTPTATAISYIPNTSSIVRTYLTDALASGTTADCNALTSSTPLASYSVEPATLEAMVARLQGKSCVSGVQTFTGAGGASLASGARNEPWGLSSLSVGQVGTEALATSQSTATAFYTANQLLRLAFGTGNTTRYYSCRQRSYDGNPRNCDLIGSGTYTITQVGDARVMALQNTPPQFSPLTYDRVLVERAGKISYGFKNKTAPYKQARLNLEAGNALLAQLGMGPSLSASDTVALVPGSWAGDWIFWPASEPTAWLGSNGSIVRFSTAFSGGSTGYQCLDSVGGQPGTAFTCTVTLDATTGALTLTEATSTATVALKFTEGTATGSSVEGVTSTAVLGRRR